MGQSRRTPAASRHPGIIAAMALRQPAGLQIALILIAAFSILTALPSLSVAAPFEQTVTLEGKQFSVTNLIGAVRIEPGSGPDLVAEIRVRGADASGDLVTVEKGKSRSGVAQLTIRLPVEEHNRFVYPGLGEDLDVKADLTGRSEIRGLSGVLDFFLHKGKSVRVRGEGSGLEIWSDLVLRVPKGTHLNLRNGVGSVQAAGTEAELELDTICGSVETRNTEGDLTVDTGSGSVIINSVRGDLYLDTGSGSVEVQDVEGTVLVDTGSGGVTAQNLEGRSVQVDTGSGAVHLRGVQCSKLEIDTGSGGVTALEVTTDQALVDTGSGSVEMRLARMGTGQFTIDTGSGGILLVLPEDASAHIEADTGTGNIRSDLKDAVIHRLEKDALDLTVGKGDASVHLDTGTGAIEIRH